MSEKSRGRRTVARHGELRSPSTWGQVFQFTAIALAVVLVSTVGVIGVNTAINVAAFASNSIDLDPEGEHSIPPDIGDIEGGVNLFLAGTDACEPEYAMYFGDRCTGPDSDGELNDVNMLLHISDEPRRVTVISFPRDLMLPIPECTNPETGNTSSAMSKQQLNSTFMYGGLACAVKTVSQLTGLNIPFAASITWGGVIEITNAIGGVEVCIANGIKDYHTGIDWPAGNRTLAGIEALQFLRTRHGVGDGGDLGRISNQQQYMSKLARKLVSEEVLTNPATLLSLSNTALQNVSPSDTLTNPLTLVQIALAVRNVPFDEIVFIQYPTFPDSSDPNRVVPNYEAADALWAALEANQPLVLTGDPSQGDGIIVEGDPGDGTEQPEGEQPEQPEGEQPEQPEGEQPTDPGTEAPEQPAGGIELPSSIAGTTAAQNTCSNGNVRN